MIISFCSLKNKEFIKEEENLKNAYKRQEDSFRSIDDFKKALSGSECLESFNPEIFDLLVETVLVGGYTNGEPDPYQITFVFKGGSQRSIDGSGFKEDRRRKKALNPVWNSEGVELHIDNKEEASVVDNGNSWWWLRSPGYSPLNTACISSIGSVYLRGDRVSNYYAVRPALWIDFGS